MGTSEQEPLVTDAGASTQTPAPKIPEHRRRITTIQLVLLSYSLVCGGPVGSEEVIGASGPLIGLILLLVVALIWALPVALVTAELAAALPHDGGYVVWAYVAFNKFWAMQQAVWSWLSGVVINAVYPVMAYDVCVHLFGALPPLEAFLVKAAVAALLCLINFFGPDTVNRSLIALTFFIMAPFVVLVVWGFPQMKWHHVAEARFENNTALSIEYAFAEDGAEMDDGSPVPPLDIHWAVLVHSLIWNYNGFHGTSMYAGEVADPGTTYPRAMLICVFLAASSYVLPLMVSSGVNQPAWTTWHDGSFSPIASAIAGDWLGVWVTVSTLAAASAMFVSELFADTYQLMGMAELGFAPSWLGLRHSKFDTPWAAILMSFFIILSLVSLDFLTIISLSNILVLLSLIQLLFSALVLRIRYPSIQKHSKLQLSDCMFYTLFGASIMGATVALVIVLIIDTSWTVLIFVTIAVAAAIVYYFIADRYIPTRVTQESLEEELIRLTPVPGKAGAASSAAGAGGGDVEAPVKGTVTALPNGSSDADEVGAQVHDGDAGVDIDSATVPLLGEIDSDSQTR